MRSTTPFRPALFNFIGSGCLYAGATWASHVGTHAIEQEWNGGAFWALFGVVQVLWAFGYLLSSLPKWGKWVDGQADTEYKLSIVVGVLFALIAGNLAYYLAYYEANLKHLYCFITALAGGFAGEKWLAPLLMRFLPAGPAPQQQPADKGS